MSQTIAAATPVELLREAALAYHRTPRPGKISVNPTKPMATQRDLSLAYSPGVAEACLEIVRDPLEADTLTARANLVAVITNGTAVLGLGDIGALAGKPVMEGKACLFKKFAGIDVFDIELDENDPDALVETIARMEPTFGGINLEDIKAPECFYIEKKLRERMKIPVFHDDQHGTAIVAAAFLLNALRYVEKDVGAIKVVTSGAGAAALACLDLFVSLGVRIENITSCDGKGVIHQGRAGVDENKARYAQRTDARTLSDALLGADVFLGLSVGGLVTAEMVRSMAARPVILAMANPTPEILPEVALVARPDAVIGTGRSDYPNQINNVLCFPFIFRGALDVGATVINEEMKLAAVRAIADLTHQEIPEAVGKAYGGDNLRFGPEYLLPKPFDPRLIEVVACAVAQAAMDSGVAQRPLKDLDAYRQRLSEFIYHTGSAMQPVFAAARKQPGKVVYAEGEDERVLRAAQVVVDERLAKPVLIGSEKVITERIRRLGLRIQPNVDVDVVDPADAVALGPIVDAYSKLSSVPSHVAAQDLWTSATLLAATLLREGKADAMLCGMSGLYAEHVSHVRNTIGVREGRSTLAVLQMLILPDRQLFITDTHVNRDPSALEVAETTVLAADLLRRLGIEPRAALLSHSNFGCDVHDPQVRKMREALDLVKRSGANFEIDGEMQGDSALSPDVRQKEFARSELHGAANLLVMPSLDAANISYNLLRITAGNGVTVGGVLLGAALPVHILTSSATVRRIVNMTAVALVDASTRRGD